MRFAVGLLLLAACSAETIGRPPPPPVDWASLTVRAAPVDAGPSAATLKERGASENYLDALASTGCLGLVNILDEDAYFALAGLKDVHGRENIIRVHQSLFGDFDRRTFSSTRRFITDSAQILEWTMTGVERATQKPIGFRGLVVLRTKDDGSIANVHLYFDEGLVKPTTKSGPTAPRIEIPAVPVGPRTEVEQTHSAEESENVAVVRGWLDALEQKNDVGYTAAMTDDVDVTTLEGARSLHGSAAARAYVKSMHASIAQLDTAVDDIWGIGSFVVVEYHIVGEQRGPIGRIPAQRDNLMKMFAVDVVELRAHKIAHVTRYDNPNQLLVEVRP